MKLKTLLMFTVLFCALSITMISCSKDKEEPAAIEVDSKINSDKLARIEKFMVKMFGVSPDAKMYDADKEIFYIHNTTMTGAEMEKLYDGANEYKLKYEKN